MAEPKKLNTFALAFKAHRLASNDESIGEMVEWSITAVLKTAVPRGTGGSNPSLSAINLENQGFAKLVHDFVHESPIFGAFFMPFSE